MSAGFSAWTHPSRYNLAVGRMIPELPNEPGNREPYSFRYKQEATGSDEAQSEAEKAEVMRYISETILTLTGGCEVCVHSVGPFCKKQRRPIKPGDPRCEFFARRFSGNPKEAASDQVRRYISDNLGIKDKRTVGRLTGES